jgi:hypothetical protein
MYVCTYEYSSVGIAPFRDGLPEMQSEREAKVRTCGKPGSAIDMLSAFEVCVTHTHTHPHTYSMYLCVRARWSFIKFCFNIPLVLTSSIM